MGYDPIEHPRIGYGKVFPLRSKWLSAGLVLLALGACSDGDDINAPPGGDATVTLAVTGSGAGAARVTTSAGVDPALSCDLSGPTVSGTCSAAYPVGTVVELTVTPGADVTFTGWAGDAASCGTATSCSVTMSTNQTVTVQLTAGPAPSGDIQVVSSTFYPDPDIESITWVAELRNTTSQWVESADVEFATLDASGAVLATTSAFVGPIPPGETRAIQSLGDFFGTEASSSLRVLDVQFGEPVNLGVAEIVSSSWSADAGTVDDRFILWTVEVRNTGSAELGSVEIDFSTYDAAGKIVAASFTFLGPIAPGETQTAEDVADYRGTESTATFEVANVGSEINVLRQKRLRAR
jgi:hypothetical protein